MQSRSWINVVATVAMLLTALPPSLLYAQTIAPGRICGLYKVPSPFNKDEAVLRIVRTATGHYQGQIVSVIPSTNVDGSARTDEKNPDPKLRSRKANEIVMFWGAEYKNNEWINGKLYDPYSGKQFGIKFKIASNGKDLDVRYYKGKPAFGINALWVRQ